MENLFFDLNDLAYLGENVIIGKSVRIRNPELVTVDDNAIIDDFTFISGALKVGRFVHVASSCCFQASGSEIEIMDFCGIATGCRIFAASSDYFGCALDLPTIPQSMRSGTIRSPVRIGECSLIGANTVVLPGVTIPNGFSCGANAKLTPGMTLKAWHLFDPESGRLIGRAGRLAAIETMKMARQYEK